MTPMFSPGPIDVAPPPILISAVGPLMTRVAGRAADGLVCHAFQTAEYLRDVTMPNVHAGLAEAGRERSGFQISMPVFVVSGFREEEVAAQAARTRQQIAFYGSTPAYRGVLEHHGWGDAQTELNRLSKRGQWVEMGNVIDDDMLGAFAIVAEPHEVPGRIAERFGGTLDRLQFYAGVRDKDRWGPIIEEIKAA